MIAAIDSVALPNGLNDVLLAGQSTEHEMDD